MCRPDRGSALGICAEERVTERAGYRVSRRRRVAGTASSPSAARRWNGNRHRFNDYRLAGRATVRIHTGEGRDTRTDLFQGRRDYVWDNNRDKATLRDDRGRVVASKSWGNHHRR
ncbi:lamin tail domain-containing protein [Streptomyces sp. NBC_01353]|uniref:lamin tail domain-containing protein n=1 Tax=Streptomyces sp. NBC_01353 TaxID=2903835 RepID=UPI002E368172|nr:lamin tail domain-containing protein [Streptomyces sp. NBC_01353]